jgi:hypothetical protein
MNAVCERVIGTLRRECLNWLIPLSEAQLRTTLRSWVRHYAGAGAGCDEQLFDVLSESGDHLSEGAEHALDIRPREFETGLSV